jgi:hypothetical protein
LTVVRCRRSFARQMIAFSAVYKFDTIPNNDKAFYVFLCHLSTSYKA